MSELPFLKKFRVYPHQEVHSKVLLKEELKVLFQLCQTSSCGLEKPPKAWTSKKKKKLFVAKHIQ